MSHSESGVERMVNAPVRVRHGYEQVILAEPARVFPLLCPVRERDWIPGWCPDWVLSHSGVAEQGCIFQTAGEEGTAPAIWVITRHEPENFHVEMVKTIPGHTVTRLEIDLADGKNDSTRATVCYEFTALGPEGKAFVKSRTAEWYAGFMQEWERLMNRYLSEADGHARERAP